MVVREMLPYPGKKSSNELPAIKQPAIRSTTIEPETTNRLRSIETEPKTSSVLPVPSFLSLLKCISKYAIPKRLEHKYLTVTKEGGIHLA